MDGKQEEEWLRMERLKKDMFFASDPRSPVPLDQREVFRGLAYWPPDPGYRLQIDLHVHDEKASVHVEDTGGHIRPLLRWGEFHFELDGQPCVLQAYKGDPEEERLFVPFRDATSGKQSYGAGRYLDLEPTRNVTPSGQWILDFNQAYNPWCAYSDAFACPFVPPENWLQVAIRAGEKTYPGHPESSERGL